MAPAGAQPLNPRGPVVTLHLDTAAPVAGPREVWAGRIGSWVLRLLALTLRIRVEDPSRLRERATGEPFIIVFWHNRILLVPVVWNRFHSPGTADATGHGAHQPQPRRRTHCPAPHPLRHRSRARLGEPARLDGRYVNWPGCSRVGHDVGITPDG